MKTKRIISIITISAILLTAMLSMSSCGGLVTGVIDSISELLNGGSKNIMTMGDSDISLEWLDGSDDPYATDAEWEDASRGSIFEGDWEPGYTQIRHIKVTNNGTMAASFKFDIIPEDAESVLTEVIDIYCLDPAAAVTSDDQLTEENRVGTVKESASNFFGATIEAGESYYVTVALKMQDAAGNEYAKDNDLKLSLRALAMKGSVEFVDDTTAKK